MVRIGDGREAFDDQARHGDELVSLGMYEQMTPEIPRTIAGGG